MLLTGSDIRYVDIIPVPLEFSTSVFEVWICPKVFGDSGGIVGLLLVRDGKHGDYSGKCPLERPWFEKEELSHLNQVSFHVLLPILAPFGYFCWLVKSCFRAAAWCQLHHRDQNRSS